MKKSNLKKRCRKIKKCYECPLDNYDNLCTLHSTGNEFCRHSIGYTIKKIKQEIESLEKEIEGK